MSNRLGFRTDRKLFLTRFEDRSKYCDWYSSKMDFTRYGREVITDAALYTTVVQYVRQAHPDTFIFFGTSLGWQDRGERLKWFIPDEDVALAVTMKFG